MKRSVREIWMIQAEFKNIVFHFTRDAAREGVASIFLFGSVAKETADNRSDIDMLVVLDTYSKDFSRLEVTNIISELALNMEKEYDRFVQVIFTNKVFDDLDENFKKNVFEDGILLYAKPPEINIDGLGLQPYVLFVLGFGGINQKNKSKIKRKLYGHKTSKSVKGREYKSIQKGKLEELHGYRAGNITAFLPQKHARKFEEFLDQHNVKYKRISMWLTDDDVIKLQNIKF